MQRMQAGPKRGKGVERKRALPTNREERKKKWTSARKEARNYHWKPPVTSKGKEEGRGKERETRATTVSVKEKK